MASFHQYFSSILSKKSYYIEFYLWFDIWFDFKIKHGSLCDSKSWPVIMSNSTLYHVCTVLQPLFCLQGHIYLWTGIMMDLIWVLLGEIGFIRNCYFMKKNISVITSIICWISFRLATHYHFISMVSEWAKKAVVLYIILRKQTSTKKMMVRCTSFSDHTGYINIMCCQVVITKQYVILSYLCMVLHSVLWLCYWMHTVSYAMIILSLSRYYVLYCCLTCCFSMWSVVPCLTTRGELAPDQSLSWLLVTQQCNNGALDGYHTCNSVAAFTLGSTYMHTFIDTYLLSTYC